MSYSRRSRKERDVHGMVVQVDVEAVEASMITFTLSDCDVSLANALRRILIAEVPTIAIDFVEVHQNSTVLHDSFIAHRLGLIPLESAAASDMKYTRDCNCVDPPCPQCGVRLKLKAECLEHDETLDVTSLDLLSQDDVIRPVGQVVGPGQETPAGIMIAKLKKGQALELECIAKKGIGKEHAKWSPVSCATFKSEPIIEFNEEKLGEMTGEQRERIVNSCPTDVFDMEDGMLVVAAAGRCMFCQECVHTANDIVAEAGVGAASSGASGSIGVVGTRNAPIRVTAREDKFTFTVETVGSMSPESVVLTALEVLKGKLEHAIQEIATLGDQ